MKKGFFQEFDGYREIAEAIEYSRTYGVNYTAEKDSADPYIERLHPSRLKLRVADVIDETPSARTLRLISEGRILPPFQAGQYIALFVTVGNIRTSRPYSISSPPNQTGYYNVTVQRVPEGLVSNYLLDDVKPGDVLESSGPCGEFIHNPVFHFPFMVLIAGGSGVTPFMSMIREAVACGHDRKIVLFYGNRDLESAVSHEEFQRYDQRVRNVHYIPVFENPPPGYTGRTGLITGELIRETLGDLEGKTFYVCGPQAMYDFCLPELERLGIPRKRLRREMYGLPSNICDDPGWPEGVAGDDVFTVKVNGTQSLEARAGEPLLTALERNGIVVPTICRCGECSMCRVRLLAGNVFQPAGVNVRKSDRRFGYIHACAAFPLEDLEIDI